MQTEAAVAAAASSRGLPRMVFVNKEDKERADFHACSTSCAPRSAAASRRSSCRSARRRRSTASPTCSASRPRVRARRPHHTDADARRRRRRGAPAARRAWSRRSSPATTSSSSATSSGDVPTAAELERTLAHEVLDGSEFPVLVGSAHHRRRRRPPGRLHLRARPVAGRPPGDRHRRRREDGRRSPADAAGTPLAHVFKTVADPFVGQLSLFKVLSGTVAADDRLVNSRTGADERLHGLFHLRGKEHVAGHRVVAGDLGGRRQARRHAHRRHAGAEGLAGARRRPTPPHRPCYGVALVPRHPVRRRQAVGARCSACRPRTRRWRRPRRGDPPDRAARLGDTHLAVALERLARKFGVHVDTEDVRVAYRETIAGNGRGRGQGQEAVAAATASSPWPTCASSPLRRAAPASSSPTRSSAGRSRATTSRRCRRASRRRWPRAACTASPSSTCASSATTASTTPSTRREMAFRTAGVAGLQAGAGQGRRRRARAGLAAHGHRAAELPGRRAGRPQLAARAGAGHRHRRTRRARDRSRSCRAAELSRYAVDLRSMTGGAGHFTCRARPLRRAPRPPRRQGQADPRQDLTPSPQSCRATATCGEPAQRRDTNAGGRRRPACSSRSRRARTGREPAQRRDTNAGGRRGHGGRRRWRPTRRSRGGGATRGRSRGAAAGVDVSTCTQSTASVSKFCDSPKRAVEPDDDGGVRPVVGRLEHVLAEQAQRPCGHADLLARLAQRPVERRLADGRARHPSTTTCRPRGPCRSAAGASRAGRRRRRRRRRTAPRPRRSVPSGRGRRCSG